MDLIPLGVWKREAITYFKETTHASDETAEKFISELAKHEYANYPTDPKAAVVHELQKQ